MVKRSVLSLVLAVILPAWISAADVTVNPISGLQTSEAGGTATFTIVLTSIPTADVTIGLTSSNMSEGTVLPASVTFTSADWNVEQTVTVTGVDDFVDDGRQSYQIITAAAVSTDATYNGLNLNDVGVLSEDDEIARINVTAANLVTTEDGTSATFTVTLNSQPTAAVMIGISSCDVTEGTVSSGSLTFDAGNWSTPQTVTVMGMDDAAIDGGVDYVIVTAAAVSADPIYDGMNPTEVLVYNYEIDPPIPVITSLAPSLGVTNGGTNVTITGYNFMPGATVRFGTVLAGDVMVVSSTEITALSPAHPSGIVDITVTNPSGMMEVVRNGFNYNDPPVIASFTGAHTSTLTSDAVVFTMSAIDPKGQPLTILYNYGDGSSDSTGSHVYTTEGPFNVVVTVSDGLYAETKTLLIVSAFIKKTPFLVGKLSAKTAFGKGGKDSCSISGIFLNISEGFNPNGMRFEVDCGGAMTVFTMGPKFRAKNVDGSMKLKVEKCIKCKYYPVGENVSFSLRYYKGTWWDDWADEGVVPTLTAKEKPMPIVIDITFGGKIYTGMKSRSSLKFITALLDSKANRGAKFAFKQKLPKI